MLAIYRPNETVTYRDAKGGVHTFTGPDCWERAFAFKEKYERILKETSE